MDLREIIDRAAHNAGGQLQDLARELNTGTNTIANWRNRPHSGPDADYIPRLAELADVPWEAVQAATNAKRTRDAQRAAEWVKRMEKSLATAGTALGALAVATMAGGSDLTEALYALGALTAYPEYTLSLSVLIVMGLWLAKTAANRAPVAATCTSG